MFFMECSIGFAKSPKPITLKFATDWPTQEIDKNTRVVYNWTKKIAEESNGRIKWQYFYSAALVKIPDTWAEIKRGTADVMLVHSNRTEFPISQAMQRFFYGTKDNAAVVRIIRQVETEFPEFAKEWDAAKVLFVPCFEQFKMHSVKPVRTLDDMSGIKVRIVRDWLKYTFTELGAIPVSLRATEVYTSLQKHIVDAHMQTNNGLKTLKTAEVEPYSTIIKGLFDGSLPRFCMNRESYSKLPPDLQKLIDDSLPAVQKELVEVVAAVDKEAGDWAIKEHNHQFFELSDTDMSRFNELVAHEARGEAKKLDEKGLPGTRILERVRELIAQDF